MSTTGTPIRRVMLILQSAAVGGMETHCIDLAAEYVSRGIVVKAIVPEWPQFDQLEERFRRAGALVGRLDTDAREGRSAQLRRWLNLVKMQRSFDPDVVHLHTPGATGGLAVLITTRLASRARLVVTEHDVPGHRTARKDLVARLSMNRLAHAIVAVSRRNAGLRTQRLGSAPRQFAAVLNGVPVPSISPEERHANRQRVRDQLGIDADRVVIGSLVRLAEGKGLHDLLRAFASVVKQFECELLLVGDGPLRGELEQLAVELHMAGRVHFAGHHAAPAAFLDAMDAFVLAVPVGSMSIALLEAMGRGVPPAITFCGPEEAVIPEETGLCAPPNDPEGLARVLLRMASDPELRSRLGQAAGCHVSHHLSVARVADDLLAIYTARRNHLPVRLRADSPPDPRPGTR